ncbi:MAG: molybdopterin molybdotransferase MoeA [Oligoflexales bacterium]|nr:molybdopterin molybdotransferase MoeA [Oligoflexales bacterium]
MMIQLKEASKLIYDSVIRFTPKETVSIENSLGRILFQDILSDMDAPPFDRVSMDGYAARREDLKSELTLLESVMAGHSPKYSIGKNECSKVMTGGIVPSGADLVFMVEHSRVQENGKIVFTGSQTADNISKKGELVKKGETVLEKGTRIKPQHISVMAGSGVCSVDVYSAPKVSVIVTGDEVVEPFVKPSETQIRNTNGLQLIGQLFQMGIKGKYYGIVKDDKNLISQTFEKALAENDVVLFTGGVSMGDFDFVIEIMREKCTYLPFQEIAIKPGKPTTFGMVNDKYCFGIPGNPLSAFCVFELLIKEFLYRLMGHDLIHAAIRMPLSEDLDVSNPDRERWIPVILKSGLVVPIHAKGSAHSNALVHADGLISCPANTRKLIKGTIVDVRQI